MAAIEPPVVFPIREKAFRLLHKQQVTPSGSGFIQTIERTLPKWYCEFETAPIDRQSIAYGGMLQFLELLEGSLNTFLAFDPTRPKPLYYMKNGGAPPASTIADIDYADSKIQLTGLAAGRLTIGDYVSYQYGDIWRLYRCIDEIDGDGWVRVKPRPIEHSGLPLTARLERPAAEFKMLGDYSETDSVGSFPTFKFTGFQFINRAT